jgi:hypothetical protein
MAGMRYFSRVPFVGRGKLRPRGRYPLYPAAGGFWDGLIMVLFAELTLFRPSSATRRDAARSISQIHDSRLHSSCTIAAEAELFGSNENALI